MEVIGYIHWSLVIGSFFTGVVCTLISFWWTVPAALNGKVKTPSDLYDAMPFPLRRVLLGSICTFLAMFVLNLLFSIPRLA